MVHRRLISHFLQVHFTVCHWLQAVQAVTHACCSLRKWMSPLENCCDNLWHSNSSAVTRPEGLRSGRVRKTSASCPLWQARVTHSHDATDRMWQHVTGHEGFDGFHEDDGSEQFQTPRLSYHASLSCCVLIWKSWDHILINMDPHLSQTFRSNVAVQKEAEHERSKNSGLAVHRCYSTKVVDQQTNIPTCTKHVLNTKRKSCSSCLKSVKREWEEEALRLIFVLAEVNLV